MTEPREYLIRKNGYFYRPNRAGYTLEKAAAGLYTRAEADREAAIEPENFTVLHESEVEDAPRIVDLKEQLADLQRQLSEAVERAEKAERERDEARDQRDDYLNRGFIAGVDRQAAIDRHAELAEALETGEAFGFDPATGYVHTDDGGAPESCVFYVPRSSAEAEVARLTASRDGYVKAEQARADEQYRLAGEVARLREALAQGRALTHRVDAVLGRLDGQAYSSTLSALNAFRAALQGEPSR